MTLQCHGANRNQLIENEIILETLSAHDVDSTRDHIISHLNKIVNTYQSEMHKDLDIKQ